MVDEKTQRIREEVIRAMAEQGEGGEAPSVSISDIRDNNADPVAIPAWENVAEMAAEARANDLLAESDLSPEDVERLFLKAVFEDVRARSADAKLAKPSQWLDAGLVPRHFTADDWEMFVYEYLEERAAQRAKTVATQSAAPIRTATRTVGVPRMLRTDEPAEIAAPDSETLELSEPPASSEPAGPQAMPASEPLAPPEVAEVAAQTADEPLCDDIVVLVGKRSYYLYSSDRMTDAYARWSFLASEDDRVLTFVECVRDESRKYPRPMEASSLSNEPFNLSPQEIDELWQAVRESGTYPDLDTLTASNGDVYYFSTDYLTPRYAASLAEWNSVERDMFL